MKIKIKLIDHISMTIIKICQNSEHRILLIIFPYLRDENAYSVKTSIKTHNISQNLH